MKFEPYSLDLPPGGYPDRVGRFARAAEAIGLELSGARKGIRAVAGATAVVIATVLVFLLVLQRPIAARAVAENQGVEWLQALACAVAALVNVRVAWLKWRGGRDAALDIMLAAMLVGLVIGEVDLDKRMLGTKIIATKFFVRQTVPLAHRALAVLIVVGPPIVLAIYALRRRRSLWSAGWEALSQPCGQVLLAGVMLFGAAQILERPLNRVPGLPPNFLEESLELIATTWFLLGSLGRWDTTRVRALALTARPGKCAAPARTGRR
jgi:hypothetical protein